MVTVIYIYIYIYIYIFIYIYIYLDHTHLFKLINDHLKPWLLMPLLLYILICIVLLTLR